MKLVRSGILLVDKPEGPSSARVVAAAKRITGARKVGHLGTLDPFASGLLPLAVNEGTKIAQYFLDADKGYSGVITLGAETDTQDRTGNFLSRREPPRLGPAEMEFLRREFSGSLQQVPPMYSALKKDGSRLYELARKGLEVEREPRPVRIDITRLEQVGHAELEFELTCSKGTYVRTLAADIGRTLGCGAYLSRLRRVASGGFRIADAALLDDLEALEDGDAVPLVPLNDALAHLDCAVLGAEAADRLRRGIQGALAEVAEPAAAETTRRVVDPEGHLVALIGWEKAAEAWRLLRVFDDRP
ncbi:MAG: tRNA pseudouridine(55) synthase TruB [Deltaproteobacteria bacterium]|nr:tRNA pseudouridine(55) synthase TruB [Deltaproteobacteria bacterium]